jgi:O-antigen ligase
MISETSSGFVNTVRLKILASQDFLLRRDILRILILFGLVLSGFILSLLTANLIVDDKWPIALSIIIVLPGFVILHKYPFLAVIIWLVFEPFLLHTESTIERRLYWIIHRSLPPLTILILIISTALRINRRKLPKLGVPELLMLGYLLASILSIIYLRVEYPVDTAYLLYDQVFSPMCLYIIVRISVPAKRQLIWLVPIIIFITFSQSIIGIVSWFAEELLPSAWIDKAGSRTTGSLVNTSVFSTTLIFSGVLSLHAALTTRPGIIQKLFVFVFLLSVYSVFATFSRAAWLAGILTAMGVIYLYPKFMFRLAIIGIPVVLVLFGAILTDQTEWAKQRLYSREAERSAYTRLAVNQAAYLMFQEKPLIGWGYGNFDFFDRRYQWRVPGFPANNKDLSSHNLYLTILAEQGITGLLLYLGPMLWLLLLSIKTLPKLPDHGVWGKKLLIVLWLVIISHMIVNNFSNMKVVFGLGMWWLTLGLIAHFIHNYQTLISNHSTHFIKSKSRRFAVERS